MVEEPEEITTLQQNNPLFIDQPHLDYQILRAEGLTHIGELSGRIWTDHNAHDPGVTMLEALCYALIDLGYRTSLPIKDLLTRDQPGEDPFAEDDNFYTPLEILSCNPTTINDYRKLLLEVEGVRNAWLEPAIVENPAHPDKNQGDINAPDEEHLLNGLYSVLLEVTPEADAKEVLSCTQALLSAHRNLCEDFHDITLLNPAEIGIIAEIEIDTTASASSVYEAILRAIDSYIAPSITYYTLQQLLDKGKNIEDVFAGRPFLTESYGFVDIDELDQLPLRTELRLSDIYRAILAIEGVVAVQHIAFDADPNATKAPQNQGNIERLTILRGYTPSFVVRGKRTCIDLTTGISPLRFDKQSIERRLDGENKRKLNREYLDLPIPRGRYLSGLNDYVSIQHEFPLVYGIGDGGLPDTASLPRKIQALQLKGYLLFYDQLLVNYLAQLSHLRDFFSLQLESKRLPDARHTYFTQSIEGVAALPRLLQTHAEREINKGHPLALPIVNNGALHEKLQALSDRVSLTVENNCGSKQGDLCLFTSESQVVCEIYVQQAIRDVMQEDYLVEVYQDRMGYFFLIRFTQQDDVVLLGTGRYPNKAGAHEAANFTTFMAVLPETYRKAIRRIPPPPVPMTLIPDQEEEQDTHTIEYHFEITYNPGLLHQYVQDLLENEEQYYERRQVFLDHLLARFAEQFTDYVLVKFGAKALDAPQKQQMVEDKSRFLDEYDDAGRNRGRAYNYLEPAWGTANVAGFEKRVALLAGMKDWKRRTLCNFEVSHCYTSELNGVDGMGFLTSIAPISTKEDRAAERLQLLQELKNPNAYPSLERRYNGFNRTRIRRLFSTVASDENIVVTRFTYGLTLLDAAGKVIAQSAKRDYASASTSLSGEAKFIREVNSSDAGLTLKSLGRSSRLHLDATHITHRIHTHTRYKWHQFDAQGTETASSADAFDDKVTAMEDFIQHGSFNAFVTEGTTGYRWQILLDGSRTLTSAPIYINEDEARKGWARSKNFGREAQYYKTTDVPNQVALVDENGRMLAWGQAENKKGDAAFIDACTEYYAARKDQASVMAVKDVCTYLLRDREGNILLTSIYCYAEAPEALEAFLLASEAARKKKAFQALGSDDFPEYRIQFRSDDELLWATSVQYDSEKERDEALSSIQRELKAHHKLVDIQEEPANYSWSVNRAADNKELMCAEGEFESKTAAQDDLIHGLSQHRDRRTISGISTHLYRVDSLQIPADYQFVYFGDQSHGSATPFLKSEQVFPSEQTAQSAYAQFVETLPAMAVEPPDSSGSFLRLSHGKDIAAVLYEPNPDTQVGDLERAESLVQYMQEVYNQDATQEHPDQHYFYRFLNTDHPAAISCQAWDTRQEAIDAKEMLCTPDVYGLEPKKPVLRVICPEDNPDMFHFALFLSEGHPPSQDESLVETTPILVSFVGYSSYADALEAGQDQMYKIIETASDPLNIGDDTKPICLDEKYGEETGPCASEQVQIAVVPKAFKQECDSEGCPEVIARRCRRYPIRVVKSNEETDASNRTYLFVVQESPDTSAAPNEDATTTQYTEEGLWCSPTTYNTPEEAEAAYLYFVALTKHEGNCRVVCTNGVYRVMMIEVLLRSTHYYLSAAAAWGDAIDISAGDTTMQKDVSTENGNSKRDLCMPTGVRKLASVFEDPEAFQPYVIDHCAAPSDCHQFRITSPTYLTARMINAFKSLEKAKTTAQELSTTPFEISRVEANDDPKRPWRVIVNDDNNAEKVVGYLHEDPEAWHFSLHYAPSGLPPEDALYICGCKPASDADNAALDPPLIFESIQRYDSRESSQEAFATFLSLMGHMGNYRTVADSEMGPYFLEVIDPDQVLAFSPNRYATRTDALAAMDRTMALAGDDGMHLVEHILLRNLDYDQSIEENQCIPGTLPLSKCLADSCTLTWQEDIEDERCIQTNDDGNNAPNNYLTGADPYSFWTTLVLPGWLERFQSEERRFLFQQMLYREAPALVGLNIVWLSPSQMCGFEHAFKSWLDWQRDCTVHCRDTGSPLHNLVQCIEALKQDPLCDEPDPTLGDCIDSTRSDANYRDSSLESIYWLDCIDAPAKPPPVHQPEPEVPQENTVQQKPLVLEKKATKKATKEKKKKATSKKKTNPSAIRALMAARNQNYQDLLAAITVKSVTTSESLSRARHFLTSPPTLDAYEHIINLVLEQDFKSPRTKTFQGFADVIMATTWNLLDYLIRENGGSIPANTRQTLHTLLSGVKAKGINLAVLASEWNSEPLADALQVSIHTAYINLLQEV